MLLGPPSVGKFIYLKRAISEADNPFPSPNPGDQKRDLWGSQELTRLMRLSFPESVKRPSPCQLVFEDIVLCVEVLVPQLARGTKHDVGLCRSSVLEMGFRSMDPDDSVDSSPTVAQCLLNIDNLGKLNANTERPAIEG